MGETPERQAPAELTELVIALTGRLGMATRLTIDFDDRKHVPLRIMVLGQATRAGWPPHLDHIVAVACGRAEPILLLIMPSETSRPSAEKALAEAAAPGGDVPPEKILASCDVSTDRP